MTSSNAKNRPSVIPDWSREKYRVFCWHPSKQLIGSIRRYQRFDSKVPIFGWVARKWIVLQYRFWCVVTGSEIPINCKIGGGLILQHTQGVIIHPEVTIGANCLIMGQVVIGTAKDKNVPSIGDHVDIGSGAKILGGIKIGSYAQIGANSVVLCNVPEGTTAVGVPAKVLEK